MVKEAQKIPVPRLMKKYREEIVPSLMKRFGYRNLHAVPKITRVSLNMGLGKSKDSPKRLDDAIRDMGLIVGQKPMVRKARKDVSNFRLRVGDSVGVSVSLRSKIMYEFLDRLISIAIPRIKDFRGLSVKSFDGRGNYSMGVTEQIIFPEISLDKLEFIQGMDISIVTTARTDEEAIELLTLLGMPFAK